MSRDAQRKEAKARLLDAEEELYPVFHDAIERLIERAVRDNQLPTPEEAEQTLTAAVSRFRLRTLLNFWKKEVDEFIVPAMLRLFRSNAKRTLDKVYPASGTLLWNNIRDVRASRWAADMRHHWVEIGETIQKDALESLQESLTLGESPQKMAARVRHSLDVSENRARTIARTEAAQVMNASDWSVSQELQDAGIEHEREWLATTTGPSARRTRPTHLEADGQTVGVDEPFMVGGAPLMYPGDPAGPPEETINCFPAYVQVDYPAIRSATRRWYEGDLVTVRFSSGNVLTGTPNHPILGIAGWVALKSLHEGDEVVRAVLSRDDVGAPYPYHGPTEIGEVYRLAAMFSDPERVGLTPPDFHGDGSDGYVDIVPEEGSLRFHGVPATEQEIVEFGLALADFSRFPLCDRKGSSVSVGGPATFVGNPDESPSRVCGSGGGTALIGGHTSRADQVSLAHGPAGYPSGGKPSTDQPAGNPVDLGERQLGFSGEVSLDQVINVDVSSFSGHVFNLDTGFGWYTANGIVSRNCRCAVLTNVLDSALPKARNDSVDTIAAAWNEALHPRDAGKFATKQGTKAQKKPGAKKAPAKPKPPKLSKFQREQRLVKAILASLDEVLPQLSNAQNKALVEKIKDLAKAFVEGQANAPHHGGGGSKSGGGGSTKKANPSTPDKSASKPASGSDTTKSKPDPNALPSGAAGIVKGIEKLLARTRKNPRINPSTRARLSTAATRLSRLQKTTDVKGRVASSGAITAAFVERLHPRDLKGRFIDVTLLSDNRWLQIRDNKNDVSTFIPKGQEQTLRDYLSGSLPASRVKPRSQGTQVLDEDGNTAFWVPYGQSGTLLALNRDGHFSDEATAQREVPSNDNGVPVEAPEAEAAPSELPVGSQVQHVDGRTGEVTDVLNNGVRKVRWSDGTEGYTSTRSLSETPSPEPVPQKSYGVDIPDEPVVEEPTPPTPEPAVPAAPAERHPMNPRALNDLLRTYRPVGTSVALMDGSEGEIVGHRDGGYADVRLNDGSVKRVPLKNLATFDSSPPVTGGPDVGDRVRDVTGREGVVARRLLAPNQYGEFDPYASVNWDADQHGARTSIVSAKDITAAPATTPEAPPLTIREKRLAQRNAENDRIRETMPNGSRVRRLTDGKEGTMTDNRYSPGYVLVDFGSGVEDVTRLSNLEPMSPTTEEPSLPDPLPGDRVRDPNGRTGEVTNLVDGGPVRRVVWDEPDAAGNRMSYVRPGDVTVIPRETPTTPEPTVSPDRNFRTLTPEQLQDYQAKFPVGSEARTSDGAVSGKVTHHMPVAAEVTDSNGNTHMIPWGDLEQPASAPSTGPIERESKVRLPDGRTGTVIAVRNTSTGEKRAAVRPDDGGDIVFHPVEDLELMEPPAPNPENQQWLQENYPVGASVVTHSGFRGQIIGHTPDEKVEVEDENGGIATFDINEVSEVVPPDVAAARSEKRKPFAPIDFGTLVDGTGSTDENNERTDNFVKSFQNSVNDAWAGTGYSLRNTQSYTGPNHGRTGLSMGFQIVDENGRRVGTMQRNIKRDPNTGKIYVSNELFTLDKSSQGKGLATKAAAALEPWYQQSGAEEVRVHANIDVGSFTWARQGFDWDTSNPAVTRMNGTAVQRLAQKMSNLSLSAEDRNTLSNLMAGFDPGDPSTWPSPQDLANVGYKPGRKRWPGKSTMLKSNWYGVKKLYAPEDQPEVTPSDVPETVPATETRAARNRRLQSEMPVGSRVKLPDGRTGKVTSHYRGSQADVEFDDGSGGARVPLTSLTPAANAPEPSASVPETPVSPPGGWYMPGDRVRNPDGRTGEVRSIQPHAVTHLPRALVRWDAPDDAGMWVSYENGADLTPDSGTPSESSSPSAPENLPGVAPAPGEPGYVEPTPPTFLASAPRIADHVDGDSSQITENRNATNMDYATSRAYQINCQRVVAAYEARRRGYDVAAQGNPLNDANSVSETLARLEGAADRNVQGRRNVVAASVLRDMQRDDPSRAEGLISDPSKYVKDTVNSWPVGSRGWVWFLRSGRRRGGHVFNVERTADGFKFVEAQNSNAPDSRFDEYMKQVRRNRRTSSGLYTSPTGDISVFRVDDLAFSDAASDAMTF